MPAGVVDVSALIFLAKLHRLDALQVLSPVLTTREALDEVLAGLLTGHRDALAVQAAVQERRIGVRRAPALRSTMVHLEEGERSVLALAHHLAGSTAVLDDLGAIKAAHSLGIRARSTPFLLLDNTAAGRLSALEFRGALDSLLREGYFLSPRLYVRLLEESAKR